MQLACSVEQARTAQSPPLALLPQAQTLEAYLTALLQRAPAGQHGDEDLHAAAVMPAAVRDRRECPRPTRGVGGPPVAQGALGAGPAVAQGTLGDLGPQLVC